ncbi:MAG TPA: PEP-CTERM sorting domain-containing protein [Acidobacteriaceae bacterium]|nr:PEP-CTERM sorting domain-containing protein [Acidobacteriaceae bacterium]
MSSTRIRLQLAAFLFILLPATAGVVAVHASATCEKFVRTYVTKPVRNRVSQATADAWAAWRIEHPNWKPNPNAHRPKYVMTREEQVKKVDFACEVPTLPVEQKIFFDTMRIDPPPVVQLPNMETETSFPSLPTEVAEVTPLPPLGSFLPPTAIPPVDTGVPAPTPEPMSLALVGSGICELWLLMGMRKRRVSI